MRERDVGGRPRHPPLFADPRLARTPSRSRTRSMILSSSGSATDSRDCASASRRAAGSSGNVPSAASASTAAGIVGAPVRWPLRPASGTNRPRSDRSPARRESARWWPARAPAAPAAPPAAPSRGASDRAGRPRQPIDAPRRRARRAGCTRATPTAAGANAGSRSRDVERRERGVERARIADGFERAPRGRPRARRRRGPRGRDQTLDRARAEHRQPCDRRLSRRRRCPRRGPRPARRSVGPTTP